MRFERAHGENHAASLIVVKAPRPRPWPPPPEKKPDEPKVETISFTRIGQGSAWVAMELDRICAAFKVNESKALIYAICGSASRSTSELEKYYQERREG